MSNLCPVLSSFGNANFINANTDSAEKERVEKEIEMISWYEDEPDSPNRIKAVLAVRLGLWREYYKKSENDFPKNKASFTRFCNQRLSAAERLMTKDNLTEAQWQDLEETIYGTYSPKTLENRLRMVAVTFGHRIDEYQKTHHSLSRAECLAELGGPSKLINSIIEDFANMSKEDIVVSNPLLFKGQSFDSLSDAQKKQVAFIKSAYTTLSKHSGSIDILCRKYINEYEVGIQVDTFSTEDDEATLGLKGKRYLDFRAIDVADTITENAKNILKALYSRGENNTVTVDDIGFPVRISPKEALQTLVQTCWTSTPETFIEDIVSASKTNPWMSTLVEQISNDEVKAAAIYTASKKARMMYGYVVFEKGVYSDKRLNTMAAHNGILREVSLNIGNHVLDPELSIYDDNGRLVRIPGKNFSEITQKEVSKYYRDRLSKLLGNKSGRDKVGSVDVSRDDEGWEPTPIPESRYVDKDGIEHVIPAGWMDPVRNKPGKRAMQWYLDNHSDEIEMLVRLARGFGMDISVKNIRDAAMLPISKKDRKFFRGKPMNRYQIIYDSIVGIYNGLANAATIEKGLIAVSDTMEDLMNAIRLSKYDDVDRKGEDNGKILQTYITPNMLTELMLELRNDKHLEKEDYQNYIRKSFLQYEGFTINGNPTGFLKFLMENVPNSDDIEHFQNFELVDESSFNHVDYGNMKSQQVASMQYTIWRGNGYQNPKFILPISADYTTCYTVGVPREALPTIRGKNDEHTSLVLERDTQGNPIRYNTESEIVRAFADEVLCEYNRMRSIEDRRKNGNANRIILKTYEEQGIKFKIFPEMNDSGFREEFETACRRSPEEGLQMLREEIARLLYENVIRDFTAYEDAGVFNSPEFKKKVKIENGKVVELLNDERTGKNFMDEFEEFSTQAYYVRQQMAKLVFSDISHFKGILDFEKRAMMQHSPATPMYFPNPKDNKQNVIYLKDINSESIYTRDFEKMLNTLADEKNIDRKNVALYLESYKRIKATDGQGFRTLPSWRRIQRALGKWTDTQEKAYNKIMSGNVTWKYIDALGIGTAKLRYAGYQEVNESPTGTDGISQQKIRVPILHKYSEQVLLPFHLMPGFVESSNTPLVGLASYAYGLEKLKANGADVKVPELFLFESGCKVGGHDVLDPWHMPDGSDCLSARQIRERLIADINVNSNAVQTLELSGLGEAATLDTKTEDTSIHITSQAEKIAFGNISPDDSTILPVGKGTISATEGRHIYDDVSTAITIQSWQDLCDELGNSQAARKLLLDEMNTMPYVSEETRLALTKVQNIDTELPLYAPQVQKEAQSIILAIIRNRLTRHKAPGARFVQKTSLGWDLSTIEYEDGKNINASSRLGIHFEGEGKDKRIAYVDAYIPITDHRLEIFANENGEITENMLWGEGGLVERGIIPEEMLYAVGYRTPSDAEHSIIPIRIKGFLSSASGRTIILPREVMVMTGHDYDGDEMPVHFKHINFELDSDKVSAEFNNIISDENRRKAEFNKKIFNLLRDGKTDEALEEYIHLVKIGGISASTAKFYKVTVDQYDYSKSPLEQEGTEREKMRKWDNARQELLFSQISSPAYTRRMLIPGGCEESKRIIKALQLIKVADTDRDLQEFLAEKANAPVTDDAGLIFKRLVKGNLSSEAIETLISKYRVPESPFTAKHAIDSFGYMIETADMIGIFAMYMSSFQMLQKANAYYVPAVYKDGNDKITKLFGRVLNNNKLFQVKDSTGKNLASRILSRLINAAVDNGKDPVLGLVNCCQEIAPLTALMCGLGMTEEQIYLILSQPSITELLNRMTIDHLSFHDALESVVSSIDNAVGRDEKMVRISYEKAASLIGDAAEIEYARESVKSFKKMLDNNTLDWDGLKFQKMLLMELRQMQGAAEDLQSFVTSIIRPESSSGSVSSTIGNTHRKLISAKDCTARILNKGSKLDRFRIGGLDSMVRKIPFYDCMTSEELMEEAKKSPIPQYTMLKALEVECSMKFMQRWFPQAKESWQRVAEHIAKKYGKKRISDNLLDRIYKDMILWKMLSHKNYSEGSDASEREKNFKEKQKYILKDVPDNLNELQSRIKENAQIKADIDYAKSELERLEARKAATGESINPEKREYLEKLINQKYDNALDALSRNSFLMKLKVFGTGTESKPRRIQYVSGGIDVSKLSDSIRRDWYMLLSDYWGEDVNRLAKDLVEYCLFTNGFGFGKYEFGHFATMGLIRSVDDGKMFQAMVDVNNTDFEDDDEIEKFITQYIQNHWDDKDLVHRLNLSKLSGRLAEQLGRESAAGKGVITEDGLNEGYFYLIVGKNLEESVLVRYEGENAEEPFTQFSKLSTTNKYGQVTVEYNPNIKAEEMKPFQSEYKKEITEDDVYGGSPDLESAPELENVPAEVYMQEAEEREGRLTPMERALGAYLGISDKKELAARRIAAMQRTAKEAKDESVDLRKLAYGNASQESGNPLQPVMSSVPQSESDEDEKARLASLVQSIGNDNAAENEKYAAARNAYLNNLLSVNSSVTPKQVIDARKKAAYVRLNEILIPMLERVGVGVGKLTAEEVVAYGEELLTVKGVTDLDSAKVLANGLREMIRVAEGFEGVEALPEEFAHLALEMLGTNHPLVQRLFNALRENEAGLIEAFGSDYMVYRTLYEKDGGENWEEKMVEEAAGKLIAKNLLWREEIKTSKLRSLIQRIVDAIRELLRKITSKSIEDAIFSADAEASIIARDLLAGRLLDQMSLENISNGNKFYSAKNNLTNAKGTIERLIKIETKHADIYERRLGHNKEAMHKSIEYISTENNLRNLKAALKNQKTEDAILKYLDNTLDLLQRIESKLDNSIRNGDPANKVTGTLSMLRDTLFSNVMALDAIRDGLADGQVIDSGSLKKNVDTMAGVVQDFFDKYKRLSQTYLEKMLSSVFGQEGVTITSGKDKGKHISIHEMATSGMDISSASALVNSMADQDDYVLKAFDSIVRNAKYSARKIQDRYAERIVVAINKLHKATGSLDQTFMFERNSKGHKTGKYISVEQAAKLSPAQKEFYDTMMSIKDEADKLIPAHRRKERGIIMIRKSMGQSIKDASGLKGKLLAFKNSVSNAIFDSSDESIDTETVFVDFEGNKVDLLPIKYLNKGKNDSYDDMVDDVASSMMAYIGMATEYNKMQEVLNILENAKFASMNRDILKKRGWRTPTEKIESDDFEFSETFTVKQAKTTIQKCLNDFMSMHVYGHLHQTGGYIPFFGGKKISVNKLVNTINSITSYSQMALNPMQRISNVTTGFAQIAIQTAGKDYFGAKDVLWASGIYIKETPDRLAETGADESHSKLSLFNERFDIGQRYNNESRTKEYGKSRASKVLNTHLLYAGLELGEDYLASTTGLAIAKNTLVKLDGKTINLYDAYEVVYRDPNSKSGAYLELKNGVTKLDGSEFTQKDELDFSKKCAAVNFSLQGIYNVDDRAAIQQYPLGSLIIMYRKWIAPSLKRRYAGLISGKTQYNELTGEEEMGYHSTMFHTVGSIIKNIVEDGQGLRNSVVLNWNNLTEYEKSNCYKSFTEFAILVGITLCLSLMESLPPEDDDDDKTMTWRDNVLIYQVLRLRNELGSQAPTPMLVQEATKILSSPMACIRLADNALKGLNLLNPFNYFGEDSIISDENRIKSGRFKGHTKAYKYFWSLPILSMRKSVENLVDPSPLINYYK